LIRREVIEVLINRTGNNPIISANGYISRDLFDLSDKPTNFYMIGSMGLASSIGLGVALKNPKKRIFIFDGDGNILMNLGSLVTIGAKRPINFVHIVFDNHSHESTGGQPTNSNIIKINEIAKAANYKVYKTSSKKGLLFILQKIKKIHGPIMILVKIKKNNYVSKRVGITPIEIKNRFMVSLKNKN